MDDVRRIIMGRDNLDMTPEEFLNHRETELQQHVANRIREYEAMMTAIGWLTGIVEPPPPLTSEGLRQQVADAIAELGGSLIERSERTALDNLNPLNAIPTAIGLWYYISGGAADLVGADETADLWYGIGEDALNTDIVALTNNAINDLVNSIIQGLTEYWHQFWAEADQNGFLIAYGKLRVDAGFLAAELAIDVALGAISGGVAAGASRVIRVVGRRVGTNTTRVIMKIGDSATDSFPDSRKVFDELIDDDVIPDNVERLMDEDNLGGADNRGLNQTEERLEPNAETPTTTRVAGARGRNEAEWTTVDGRATEVNARLREDFGETARSREEINAQNQVRTEGGIEGDHAGHMIAHRFTGDQGTMNLFPQQGNFNTSAYKRIENEWGRAIAADYEVQVNVRLTPPGAARPDQVEVRWQYYDAEGNPFGEAQREIFQNAPGQTYDSVYFRTD